jgi:tryptophan halogenase
MKIVIVGGGTAGWISAAMLLKYTTGNDITVIDSSKIGIIGAGEGSTGTLPWLITDTWPDNSINEIDFLRKTKGTLKLGINLKNWKGDGTQRYSPFHGSPTATDLIDTAMFGSILKYGRSDYASMHSLMLDDKLTTFRKDNRRITYGFKNHSYHFDGVEVGKFFKEWCIARGVLCIDAEIEDITFNEKEYIQSIQLSNGQIIDSSLWLDCSGFARVLMSKTRNKWISYKNNLPTNSAIPFSMDIHSKVVKFETEATAMNSGWMWKIPLQHRHGCGYVYCDGFQSYEQSLEELNKKIGYEIEPIKHIKFEPGRYENLWYNNIIAIGLSQNFLEPLQATSIHTSITSLSKFIFNNFKGNTFNYDTDGKSYNNDIGIIIDDYKDFIQMHYLTGRNDTPFWKFITNELKITDKNKHYREISKYRTIGLPDIESKYGTAGYSLWCHILDNCGLYDRGILESELLKFNKLNQTTEAINLHRREYDKIKSQLVGNEEFFKYLKL